MKKKLKKITSRDILDLFIESLKRCHRNRRKQKSISEREFYAEKIDFLRADIAFILHDYGNGKPYFNRVFRKLGE